MVARGRSWTSTRATAATTSFRGDHPRRRISPSPTATPTAPTPTPPPRPPPPPAALVRGARNAPRPPGDDTAGPPTDYNPLAHTDPTPVGPNSIPTPYGGPQLPTTP